MMNINDGPQIRKLLLFVLSVVVIHFFSSCNNDPVTPAVQYGKLKFKFEHRVEGESLVIDAMKYTNAAGNEYLVNEIQYFISEVSIHDNDGNQTVLNNWEDIHYVDTDLENTLTYALKDDIEPGNYQNIKFTFGLSKEKNQSLMFVNPPESLMFWPELLGGGYHYMKLNGKWVDTLNQVSPFNFHLGIGQIYYSFPDSITEYVHNVFRVGLPDASFEIKPGETTELKLVMNIENWFQNPHIFNHDDWGGDIMQKQDAMKLGCENGWNVFTIE